MVKITSKIKFMISVLSVIIITIGGVTVFLNYKTQKDSNLINVAGKERMLTQKITKDIFLNNSQNSIDFSSIKSAQKEFETSLNDLIKGNKEKGIYPPPNDTIYNSLVAIQKSWFDFVNDIESYQINKLLYIQLKDSLISKNEILLDKSDMIVKLMVQSNLDGHYIDRSGEQRMLTQKMAFHLSSFVLSKSSSDFKKFYEALDSFEKGLNELTKYNIIKKNLELNKNIEEVLSLFVQYKKDSYSFIDNQMVIDKVLDTIATKNVMILNNIDEVVTAYTNDSKQKREFLQIFQYIAISIAIIFIIYSFALVLNIKKLFERFVAHSKDISNITTPNQPVMFAEDEPTDELSIAVKHIDSFAKDINKILAEANKAINESKSAIEKLANVAQSETHVEGIEEAKLKKALDTSEDIAIQSLEDLANTAKMLEKLQNNFNNLHK
ncbi:MAG: type IV pili methyl-accepting chemotaxis transducer N-terminal domain-containing protein [Arcobacteraceae bacterium]|nr:type IV pili methyl-accepting chemotaxis transducer N-terminal domain-containing protein [Arcobacteraceae bacterium]